MAQIVYDGTNTVVFGTKITGKKPNIGCYVELYDPTTARAIGQCTTDRLGAWSITVPTASLVGGRYIVKFIGSGTIQALPPGGDWEYIDVASTNAQDLLVFSTIPNAEIVEQTAIVDVNKSEYAVGQLNLSAIEVKGGELSEIDVYYKLHCDATLQFLQSIPFEPDETGLAGMARFSFFLQSKTVSFDFEFRLKSVNAIGKYASGDDAIISITDLYFNGIEDLQELLEVQDLAIVNASSGESGVLKSLFAELQWEDIRRVEQGYFPISSKNGKTGEQEQLTFARAQTVRTFQVFMYVSPDGNPPPHTYPAVDPGWYYVGEFTSAEARVRCPKQSQVAFWVGMRSEKTDSKITKNFIQY